MRRFPCVVDWRCPGAALAVALLTLAACDDAQRSVAPEEASAPPVFYATPEELMASGVALGDVRDRLLPAISDAAAVRTLAGAVEALAVALHARDAAAVALELPRSRALLDSYAAASAGSAAADLAAMSLALDVIEQLLTNPALDSRAGRGAASAEPRLRD